MSKNTLIILGDFYDKMIQEELNKGTYTSASEIIREGLRLIYEKNSKIKGINDALEKGENSGKALPYRPVEFLNMMVSKKGSV